MVDSTPPIKTLVDATESFKTLRNVFLNNQVDYLTIKAFLLERFLHDALYEAPTAEVFNEFLDIKPAPAPLVSFASSGSPSLPRAS